MVDERAGSRRWFALALLCTAFFMVILDVAIVGVAAPSIQRSLGFSREGLQWVVSGYAIAFGGLLLLGGRLADLVGRRRAFLAGTGVFTAASLAAGLASSPGMLVSARVGQGVGAAVLTPAALATIAVLFEEGPARNRALGVWNAIGAGGGTTGLLLGGVLTDRLGWEWLFYVNLPVGVAVVALAPMILPESQAGERTRRFDVAGGALVTGALVALVYGLVRAPEVGWTSARTVVPLGLAGLLLALFVLVEARAPAPLAPLHLLRRRSLVAGNALVLLTAAALFAWFFVATLFLQQALRYSPLEAGLAFLAGSLAGLVGSGIAQALASKAGIAPTALIGSGLMLAGLALQLGAGPDAGYARELLPAFALVGGGSGFAFVAGAIGALSGVGPGDAGVASGLVNASQQIGGAIGVAVLTTALVARTPVGAADPAAVTEGFHAALAAGMVFVAVAGLVAPAFLRARGSTLEAAPATE